MPTLELQDWLRANFRGWLWEFSTPYPYETRGLAVPFDTLARRYAPVLETVLLKGCVNCEEARALSELASLVCARHATTKYPPCEVELYLWEWYRAHCRDAEM